MRTETKLFAGEPIPSGVTHWSVFGREDGERRMALGDGGVEVGEFPIEKLSIEAIVQTWGPGSYRVQWIGKRKGGTIGSKGSRNIKIPAPAPVVEQVPAATAAPEHDPLAGAFRIVDAIDRRAAIQAERDRAFLTHVLDAGRGDSALANEVRELRSLVRSQAEQMSTLLAGAGAVSEDEDEDEDDEDEDEDDDRDDGRIFRPGESIRDTAIAEGLNALVAIAKDLAPVAQAVAAAKIQALAEELKQKQQQQQAPALNGATTTEAAG